MIVIVILLAITGAAAGGASLRYRIMVRWGIAASSRCDARFGRFGGLASCFPSQVLQAHTHTHTKGAAGAWLIAARGFGYTCTNGQGAIRLRLVDAAVYDIRIAELLGVSCHVACTWAPLSERRPSLLKYKGLEKATYAKVQSCLPPPPPHVYKVHPRTAQCTTVEKNDQIT